jgi:MarR family transcriptional regulator, organic hydroperoxide resistance regulator
MSKVTKEAARAAELLFELFLTYKRRFHETVREFGLTQPQAATLLNLEPGRGLPMSTLADLLMCDASNVTGIVDKLELRGLTRREPGEDRRVKVLTLTAEGEALRATMRARIMAPPAWMLDLPRDEQKSLCDLLERAAEAARKSGELTADR